MSEVTGYDHALAHLRQRAAEMVEDGEDVRRLLPFVKVALRDFAREFGDPAKLEESMAEIDRAYEVVRAELAVPQQRRLEVVR